MVPRRVRSWWGRVAGAWGPRRDQRERGGTAALVEVPRRYQGESGGIRRHGRQSGASRACGEPRACPMKPTKGHGEARRQPQEPERAAACPPFGRLDRGWGWRRHGGGGGSGVPWRWLGRGGSTKVMRWGAAPTETQTSGLQAARSPFEVYKKTLPRNAVNPYELSTYKPWAIEDSNLPTSLA